MNRVHKLLREVIAIVLLGVLVFSLIGCGSKKEDAKTEILVSDGDKIGEKCIVIAVKEVAAEPELAEDTSVIVRRVDGNGEEIKAQFMPDSELFGALVNVNGTYEITVTMSGREERMHTVVVDDEHSIYSIRFVNEEKVETAE